jgi:hypothetical protein
METANIAIDSSSAEDNLCRLEHAPPTVSDWTLDEGLKRALERTCNIETPANKKQKKKESWAFCEPAKVFMPPPSTIELPKSNVISRLGGLAGDTRRAMLAEMLQEASELAQAIGKLDPDPESRANGRRRFHRRNSFVIHRYQISGTGILQAPVPSISKIVSTEWNTSK